MFIVLALICRYTFGQSIDYATNAPRNGDKYEVRQVEYFAPGNEGEEIIWDFSDLKQINVTSQREYFLSPDSVFLGINEDYMYKFNVNKDSLVCYGYDTRLKHMSYSEPMTMMIYPFCYGNSISNHFCGLGDYCKKLVLKNTGTLIVEADAEGAIIYAEGDTLRNVLRVHTTRLNSVSMHAQSDTLFADTTRMKQEIEECYAWYVRGYRYPLYETSSVSFYDNLTPLSCVQKAYRYLPFENRIENDSVNEQILYEDSIAKKVKTDIIHYEIQNSGSNLTINYSLDSTATINALVSNNRGILYERQSTHQPEGTGYQMSFRIMSLPKGDYVLYINVNGKVYNEKFNVK